MEKMSYPIIRRNHPPDRGSEEHRLMMDSVRHWRQEAERAEKRGCSLGEAEIYRNVALELELQAETGIQYAINKRCGAGAPRGCW